MAQLSAQISNEQKKLISDIAFDSGKPISQVVREIIAFYAESRCE